MNQQLQTSIEALEMWIYRRKGDNSQKQKTIMSRNLTEADKEMVGDERIQKETRQIVRPDSMTQQYFKIHTGIKQLWVAGPGSGALKGGVQSQREVGNTT